MLVDPSHRDSTRIYQPETYYGLVERCTDAFRASGKATSLVLCGSVAKPDIVPGWSDLDLIVFLTPSNQHSQDLLALRESLILAKDNIEIGIGLDIVYLDEFMASNKICGRPRAMTYEVACYGRVCFGRNPFTSLSTDTSLHENLQYEKFIAINAEIHNWRRAFMAYRPVDVFSTTWAAHITKTALKLLKHEVGASKEPPFTHQGNLDRFLALFPSHPAAGIFSLAVDIRRNWLEYASQPESLRGPIDSINEMLAAYPLPAKPQLTTYP